MNFKILKYLLFFIILFTINFVSAYDTAKRSTLIVEITGIESNEGIIRSHIYQNTGDFPTKSSNAIYKQTGKIVGNKCIIKYDNIPFGVYAMTTHHDENNNGKMDKTWIGTPAEGYGISNNPRILVSAPDFEEAKFTIKSDSSKIYIKMKY